MTIFKFAERIGKSPEEAARLIQSKYRNYIQTAPDGKLNLDDDLLKLPEFNIPLKGSHTVLQISEDMGISKQALQKRMARDPLKSMLDCYIYLYHGTKYISPAGIEIIQKSSERRMPDFLSDDDRQSSTVYSNGTENAAFDEENSNVKSNDYTQSMDKYIDSIDVDKQDDSQSIDVQGMAVDVDMTAVDVSTDRYRDTIGTNSSGISGYTSEYTDKSIDKTMDNPQSIDVSTDRATIMNQNRPEGENPENGRNSADPQSENSLRSTIDYAVKVMADQLTQKDNLLLSSYEEKTALINTFTEQLRAKDEQLKNRDEQLNNKDSQIKALMEQNISLSAQLSAEQALHAGTMSNRQMLTGEGQENPTLHIIDPEVPDFSEYQNGEEGIDNSSSDMYRGTDAADDVPVKETAEDRSESLALEIAALKERIEQLEQEKQKAQNENVMLKSRGFFQRLFNVGS